MHRLLVVLMETAMLQAAAVHPFPLTIPLAFEDNRGQSPSALKYVVTHANAGMSCEGFHGRTVRPYSNPLYSTRFVNANRRCEAALSEPDGSVSRYYRGGFRGDPIEALARYRRARFLAVWPGVDVEYRASDGIEIAFQLSRASNLSAIRLQTNGLPEVTAEQNGVVAVRARQESERITSFTAEGVNPALPLTLRMRWQPMIDREIETLHAVDGDGNRYVGSKIIAYEDLKPYPAVCLADSRAESCPDVYVASFAPSGTLRYVVYLLGSRYEEISGIAVDAGGNVFLAGTTYSKDFATTAGAYQTGYAGPEAMSQVGRIYPGGDAFVTKLHGPTGGLIYSTYVGTAGSEGAGFLHADESGQATILVGSNTPGLPSIGEAIVENPYCCVRLIGLDEAGGALRYAIATRSWLIAGARDGSMAIPWPDYPNESGRNELAVIRADGSLRYRRTIRGASEYAISSVAFRPDGSLWLASYRRTETPERIVWDLYQVPADGGDQILITTTPAAQALWPDEDGGFWLAVGGSQVPATPESVMESCLQCGGLMHYDSSGTLRFASVTPFPGKWLGVARDRVYFWTDYSRTGGFLSYALDENGKPGPVLSAVVNANGGAAPYVAGGMVALLGARLGPREEVHFPLDESGRAATRVGGVRVLVGGRACVILSASAGRLMVLLPLTLPGFGQGLLTVEQDDRLVFALPVQYSSGPSPAVLGGPNTPPGLGVQNEDGTLNGPDNPAPPGSVLRFYAVAVGQTAPPAVEGEVVHRVLPKPVANIDARFGITNSGYPLLSLQQAPGYVTGIYEAKFQLRPMPLGFERLPISLGIAGTSTWQVEGPYVYVR